MMKDPGSYRITLGAPQHCWASFVTIGPTYRLKTGTLESINKGEKNGSAR